MSPEETLNNLKNTIRYNGRDIIEKEKSKIIPRNPNVPNMVDYIEKQRSFSEQNAYILEKLLKSIQYISSDQLFNDLEDIANELNDTLEEQNVSRFYIVLTGKKEDNSIDSCMYKSNLFIALMFMSFNVGLIDKFVDFICETKPLYTSEIDHDIQDYVYIDDATFSGTQMTLATSSMMKYLSGSQPLKDVNLHIVLLYVTERAKDFFTRATSEFFTRKGLTNVSWYSTDVVPNPLSEVVEEIIDHYGKNPNYRVEQIIRTYMDDERKKDSFERYLFYTDLKIADFVSIYPRLLLHPLIIKTEGYENSIISNCEPIDTSTFQGSVLMRDVDNGNYCPKSVYKKDEWKNFVKDNVVVSTELYSRKRVKS